MQPKLRTVHRRYDRERGTAVSPGRRERAVLAVLAEGTGGHFRGGTEVGHHALSPSVAEWYFSTSVQRRGSGAGVVRSVVAGQIRAALLVGHEPSSSSSLVISNEHTDRPDGAVSAERWNGGWKSVAYR